MHAPLTIADALPRNECERLLALIPPECMRPAGLVGSVTDTSIRRAEVAWLDDVPEAAWVMDRMTGLIARANREAFGFEIDDLAESAQAARYDAAQAAHFDWHTDIGAGALAARRKLTVVVQLSDPTDYEGGLLELRSDSNILAADAAQGTATVFPSFVLHRVTPVTEGLRWSLASTSR